MCTYHRDFYYGKITELLVDTSGPKIVSITLFATLLTLLLFGKMNAPLRIFARSSDITPSRIVLTPLLTRSIVASSFSVVVVVAVVVVPPSSIGVGLVPIGRNGDKISAIKQRYCVATGNNLHTGDN